MTGLDQLFAGRAAVVIPDAVDPTTAAAVRARLTWRPYRLIDRGRYHQAERVDEPALLAALTARATAATGRALEVTDLRALRLGPGDYLLAHHDRIDPDPRVELVLDLSRAAVPDAEVHYRRHGQVVLRFPGGPGALAIVERDAAVTCNHTYLTRRRPDAEVVRLVVRLRDKPA